MCFKLGLDFPTEMKTRKNDHPGYSFERAPWALVTGVGPLNLLSGNLPAATIIGYRGRCVNTILPTRKSDYGLGAEQLVAMFYNGGE